MAPVVVPFTSSWPLTCNAALARPGPPVSSTTAVTMMLGGEPRVRVDQVDGAVTPLTTGALTHVKVRVLQVSSALQTGQVSAVHCAF